ALRSLARIASTSAAARESSQSSAGPTGRPSSSTSHVPSPCPVTAIAAAREARSGTFVASPRSAATVSFQVRGMSCSTRPPGDVRLIAKPLIGDNAHPHIPCPDGNLLRPDTYPHARQLTKCLLRRTVERVASNLKNDVRTDRQAEAAIRGRDICRKQVHRRLA